MAEINDTYQTPERPATEFVGETYVSLHEGSADLIPHKNITLTREAMNFALSATDKEVEVSQELGFPTDPELIVMGTSLKQWAQETVDGQLNIFDEAA